MFVLGVALAACGGDGKEAEPLIAGSVEGSYEGRTFTAVNGFTAVLTQGSESQDVIGLGTGLLYCGIQDSNDPPNGRGVIIRVDELVVGSVQAAISIFETGSGGNYQARGSLGTLEITSVTDTSVAATVAFTTEIEGQTYSANGTFEVLRCP